MSPKSILPLVLCAVSAFSLDLPAEEAPPNILLILADDLGYGDLACYGNKVIQTPHLDQLASEGIRLTDCYSAAANCSPARAGIMTGRTPWRVGIHNWIPYHSPMHVRDSEITIATLLRDNAGYNTAHIGKWHLNGSLLNEQNIQPQPGDHGFNEWFSTQNNALPNHHNPDNFVSNGSPVGPLDGYAAHIVARRTGAFLKQHADNNGKQSRSTTASADHHPFFAFVCFHEPHEPIASAPEHQKPYSSLEDPAERAYNGNVTQLDHAVGRILETLDELGLRENTLVIFTSDNGPAITGKHPYGNTGPLRSKKGAIYEGGIRVPGIVRWPGVIKAGSVSAEPIIGTDFLPTFCALAGIDPPADRKLDGTDLTPLIQGGFIERNTPLYWHFYRAKSDVKVAMREGPWKLLARLDGPLLNRGADITIEEIAASKTAELTGFELYHLGNDVAESADLKDAEPERFAAMRKRLTNLYHEVRDESPSWPEWTWPKYESQRIVWPDYKPLIKPPK
jgi:arylsulfatase A